MKYIHIEKHGGIATLKIDRGKVNAINPGLIDELREAFNVLETDKGTRAVILTGQGKFFSFGLDIPELISHSKEEFTDFLIHFTSLYTYLFGYPKPVVAAINGHSVAGGCMLALTCDYRIMITGKAKISLNEIDFGASVFAGSTEMLRFWMGNANATAFLYSGAMYTAQAARDMGLVQEVTLPEELIPRAKEMASALASKNPPAFASIKSLLRGPTIQEMIRRERASIDEFIDIWYSEPTWSNVQKIKIHP